MPTFEEYQKATKFARFRYRFSWLIFTACFICLLFLLFFVVRNVNEMKAGDMRYCVSKTDVTCICSNFDKDIYFFVNSTSIEPLEWVQRK